MDYSKTLNLPKTDFPMKANLPQLEPRLQAYWEEIDLYGAAQARTRGRPKYILHDGPPYSNGDIHLGQALNKILKDIVVKFKSMQGFDSPYIPGWDNHGLPTEIRAIKTFDLDRHRIEVMELRRKCAETARHFVGVQRDQFRRLGVRGDWGRPYLTMAPVYEAAVLGVLADLVGRDCIYRGLRPVHWCWTCETALAEAEIEYQEHVSPAIYVRFPLVALPPSDLPSIDGLDAAVIIWTTTPWTLPANVAVALHPDLEYVLVRASGRRGARGPEHFLLARPLLDSTMTALGVTDYEVIGATRGSPLEGGAARHPFVERDSLIVLADYVTWDQGTGAVHTAPGHGREDFETGRRYHLPTLQPLDDRGVFGPDGGQFAGQHHLKADPLILAELERRGALLARENLSHQYPHCWRCHQPVIFRATEQWFMAVDHFTPEALAAIEEVTWIPRWGQSRIANMVAERPDWCISRQRGWGIPIPAFYCEACGEPVLTVATVQHVQALVAAHGSDVWFQRPEAELVPAGLSCPKCGGTAFRKERDILDVWFDSGSSHAAVLEARPELASPADLYLEGSDQHRGWFQASLWTSIAGRGRAPYRAVLTHGFFLDETGRKMSKSLGNIVDPQEVARRHGADILRLWVAYVDFKADMPISEDIFEQVSEGYRRLRNTIRFLLANLYDFDPAGHLVSPADLPAVDRWALHRLTEVIARTTRAYEEFEFHRVYYTLHQFCAVDLSQFYLDQLKDRLYVSAADDPGRRAAQTVLYHLARTLAGLLAPVLSHTAEEVWRHLPGDKPPSIQLTDWPAADESWRDPELGLRWERFFALRDEVAKALEEAKAGSVIRQPMEAAVTIYGDADDSRLLASFGGELARLLIVSAAEVRPAPDGPPANVYQSSAVSGFGVEVKAAAGQKCARCWLYRTTVGADDEHPQLCDRCAATVRAVDAG